jgi:beta-barrel assembly-enhancing protease
LLGILTIFHGAEIAHQPGMTRRLRPTGAARHFVAAIAILAITASTPSAQTPIERHKNNFSPEQDVQLGRQAASEIRSQLPMLDDERTEQFVERIGDRLIGEIPEEFRQPAFQYSFDVVNLREINAFALPGGPMFVHRGMIQAARSEGEVAGVMAHELAHVILRHGTVQATRGQKLQLGAMAGQVLGAILGGRTGAGIAQGSELLAGGYFLKFSREFEREADLFGAQLMARAGYDPRAMASMFETIERQGGSRGPEWMSSHPNPGNRVQAINREAAMLRVDGNAGSGGDLQAINARLQQMPQAPTSQQIAKQGRPRRGETGTTGVRTGRVDPPSSQWRSHQPGEFLRLSVPANWEPMNAGGTVRYAPDGGYIRTQSGQSAFTHGIEVGVTRVDGGSLQQQTERLLRSFAEANPQLRRVGGYSQTTIGGRQGLTATLNNVSDVTGQTEAVNVSTVQLRDGSLLFLLGVAPRDEARPYFDAFGRVRESVRLADER